MNNEILYTLIVMSVIFLFGLIFSYSIIKTNFLYDKDNARWKSGINLPGLDAKPEDTVNHKGFKKFIGINTLILLSSVCISTIVFMLLMPQNPTANQEALWAKIFISILYLIIIIPMCLMFSDYKEKYITRVTSKKPKHHKILLIFIVSLLVITAGLAWIFI